MTNRAWICLLACIIASAAPKTAPHIKNALAAYQKAQAAIQTHDWPTAEKECLRAIDIEPTFSEAYRLIIDLYLSTSRPAEAGLMLTRLLQFEPDSVSDRIRLGRLLLDQQQWARALAQFSLAMKKKPGDPEALYGFAYAADRNGMPEHALEAAARGAKDYPGDSRFGQLAGQIRARIKTR